MAHKNEHLHAIIDQYTEKDVIIAFSGGVDSALLAKVACTLAHKKGHNVHAVTLQTSLHPMVEIAHAEKIAREIGAIHHIVEVDELEQAGIINNPVDRCYLCKKYLFGQLKKMADAMQIGTMMDGTNKDDTHAHRPGLQALIELGIISPLAAAGFSKDEVRQLAGNYGLSVAGRSSTPCLATRFPYGTTLSRQMLETVARGEDYLKSLGFYNVRLRMHNDICRIEVDSAGIDQVCRQRTEIVAFLKTLGYRYITIDLEGFRSGSMDR